MTVVSIITETVKVSPLNTNQTACSLLVKAVMGHGSCCSVSFVAGINNYIRYLCKLFLPIIFGKEWSWNTLVLSIQGPKITMTRTCTSDDSSRRETNLKCSMSLIRCILTGRSFITIRYCNTTLDYLWSFINYSYVVFTYHLLIIYAIMQFGCLNSKRKYLHITFYVLSYSVFLGSRRAIFLTQIIYNTDLWSCKTM